MMSNLKFFLLVIVYLVVLIVVASLAYEQGEADGLRSMCLAGDLVVDVDGVVSCVVGGDVSLIKGVYYNGS
jgi:hypothetical protein